MEFRDYTLSGSLPILIISFITFIILISNTCIPFLTALLFCHQQHHLLQYSWPEAEASTWTTLLPPSAVSSLLTSVLAIHGSIFLPYLLTINLQYSVHTKAKDGGCSAPKFRFYNLSLIKDELTQPQFQILCMSQVPISEPVRYSQGSGSHSRNMTGDQPLCVGCIVPRKEGPGGKLCRWSLHESLKHHRVSSIVRNQSLGYIPHIGDELWVQTQIS